MNLINKKELKLLNAWFKDLKNIETYSKKP